MEKSERNKTYTIQQVYKVHIEYEVNDFVNIYDLNDFMLNKPLNIKEVTFFTGNACCNPYFILESESKEDLENFVESLLVFAQDFNGFKLIG